MRVWVPGLLCALCLSAWRCEADINGAVGQCRERLQARGYDCFAAGRVGIDWSPLDDAAPAEGEAATGHGEVNVAAREMWAANGLGEPRDSDRMTVLADGSVCVKRDRDSEDPAVAAGATGGRKLAGEPLHFRRAARESDPIQARDARIESDGKARGLSFFSSGPEFGVEPSLPDTSGGRVRVPIEQSTDFPLRAVGQLGVGCSGTLVGPCHYLTAGHCVWNEARFQRRGGTDFNPGRNGGELAQPLGRWQTLQVYPALRWLLFGNSRNDAALVQLEGTPGLELGYMNFSAEGLPSDLLLNIAGYPGDKPIGEMWFDACDANLPSTTQTEFGEFEGLVGHTCETAPGNSGSGMWAYSPDDGSRVVAAIHTSRIVGFSFGLTSQGLGLEETQETKGVHLAGDLLRELKSVMEDMECVPS